MFNKQDMIDRFIDYVKIDTQSDSSSGLKPSTSKQFNLLKILKKELTELGLTVDFDDVNGYLYSKINANKEGIKRVGFLAHVDTSPDMSGANVNPQVIDIYNGEDIKLNDNYALQTSEFNELLNYKGQTLITTDGTTLLGADDKAGITIIMEMIKYYINNPKIEHGDICIAFTTDEEIGMGTEAFDIQRFGADFAYTIDGGALGNFEFENFNAAFCKIEIEGKNIHPGLAKDKMINSLELAINFHEHIPKDEKPEHTEGYEGFYMLHELQGSVEHTTLTYIIRDHDKEKFTKQKELIKNLYDEIILKQAVSANLQMEDQYYNMLEKVKPVSYVIDFVKQAMKNVDVEMSIEPIRGGTDGAKLSYMGLPCPNLFTGAHNFHGRYEYLNVDSMIKSAEVVVEIIKIVAKN